jgi:hypothetical protein
MLVLRSRSDICVHRYSRLDHAYGQFRLHSSDHRTVVP